MPTITGTLTDAGAGDLEGLTPRLEFVLSRASVHGSAVIVSKPIVARTNLGSFSVDLESNEPGDWYAMHIVYADRDGDTRRHEVAPHKVFVTKSAALADTLLPPTGAPMVYLVHTGDPDPAGPIAPRSLLLNVDTGELKEWN